VTEYINNFVEFALESTGVPQLTAPQISKHKVALPPTVVEQQAIADVLSDMDNDITALEARLTKARHIKQGMMHNLLTGRIRLV
jgi:type I restriction enzyme S subunit